MAGLYAPDHFTVRASLLRPLRVAKDRSRDFAALVIWEVGVLAIIAVIAASFVLITRAGGGETDPIGQAVNTAFIVCLLLAVWAPCGEAAWLRLMTGRRPFRLPPYRLWKDEGRALLTHLLVAGAFFLLTWLTLVVISFLNSLVINSAVTPGWLTYVAYAVFGAVLAALWIAAMRLTVAAPISIADQSWNPIAGWRATRGVTLRFVGAHLSLILAFILLVVPVALSVYLLGRAIHDAGIDNSMVFWFAPIAFVLLALIKALYAFHRGINAEAALVHLARTDMTQARVPTPPASPDAPGPVPEGA
ncbi:MAG: hypothetical protein RKE49_10895 [Oceanicaulis sp.]